MVKQVTLKVPKAVTSELNSTLDDYEQSLREGMDEHFGSELASSRPLLIPPKKATSVQKPINAKKVDVSLNRIRKGMLFIHKTITANSKPVTMKVFEVAGGKIYFGHTDARRPEYYCDPPYFFKKVLGKWAKPK